VGEFRAHNEQDVLPHHQTNVYLKCDANLLDVLCFADKASYIKHPMPKQGDTLRI